MKMRMEEDFEKKKKMLQEKMYDENSSVLEAQDDSQMTDISQETFPGTEGRLLHTVVHTV